MPRKVYYAGVLFFSVCTGAFAKCPMAVVEVKGRVLTNSGQPSTVTVDLKTPKGHFGQTTEVKDKQFRLLVRFPTFSFYSPFGHRCNNIPSVVLVSEMVNGRIVLQQKMDFRREFEKIRFTAYRAREEVVLGATRNK
jgi:hypothetical protein